MVKVQDPTSQMVHILNSDRTKMTNETRCGLDTTGWPQVTRTPWNAKVCKTCLKRDLRDGEE